MTVTTVFAGVANVLVTDGTSSILIDGYFSRPSLRQLFARRLRPSRPRIREALGRLEITGLNAVLVSHSHFDHALDSPVVAEMTGAELGGTSTTQMIARGYGLGHVPFRHLDDGRSFTIGAFTITPIQALHSEGDRFPGEILLPLPFPARASDYLTGGCFSFHIDHPDGAVFVHPTANFIPGALASFSADIAYLGGGAVGAKPIDWIEKYWHETAGMLSAAVVRPVHWDAFWRPLSKPLKPLPRPIDRLDVTMRELTRLADTDIDLALPKLWQGETVQPR